MRLLRCGQQNDRMPVIGPEAVDQFLDRGQGHHLSADLGEALGLAEDPHPTLQPAMAQIDLLPS